MNATATTLGLLGLLLGALAGFVVGRRATEPQLAALSATNDALARERDGLRQAEQEASERAAIAEADVAGMRTALDYERRSAAERVALVEQSQQRLAESFRSMSSEALDGASRHLVELAASRLEEAGARARKDDAERQASVENLVSPLRETLDHLSSRLRELENARTEAYATLVEQVRALHSASDGVRTQTAALVTALRKPQARGAWGEMQLRRVVEVAGMVARCDFTEQLTVTSEDGVQRPDLVVHLAGGRSVVVDAKVPLAAFLDATETTDDHVRAERLRAHARHVRAHVDNLSSKAYWRRLSDSPEFVVLFVPAEAFLAPALDHDPGLLEYASGRNVIVATPTTLIAMLRAIAHGWTQEVLTARTREIFELGRDLYSRLGTLGEHVGSLGKSLTRAVTDYNAAVGSLEGRVFVPARRLAAMEVVSGELATPPTVTVGVRALSAAELTAGMTAAGPTAAVPTAAVPTAAAHHGPLPANQDTGASHSTGRPGRPG